MQNSEKEKSSQKIIKIGDMVKAAGVKFPVFVRGIDEGGYTLVLQKSDVKRDDVKLPGMFTFWVKRSKVHKWLTKNEMQESDQTSLIKRDK